MRQTPLYDPHAAAAQAAGRDPAGEHTQSACGHRRLSKPRASAPCARGQKHACSSCRRFPPNPPRQVFADCNASTRTLHPDASHSLASRPIEATSERIKASSDESPVQNHYPVTALGPLPASRTTCEILGEAFSRRIEKNRQINSTRERGEPHHQTSRMVLRSRSGALEFSPSVLFFFDLRSHRGQSDCTHFCTRGIFIRRA